MKPSSMGAPKIYLGAKIGKLELRNGVKAFYFSMLQYVQEAIKNAEKHMAQKNINKRASTLIITNYSPELDGSDELDEIEATYYQSLIGILRWLVEMGRMDISMEVSALSSHVALSRIGHLNQVYHIFAYIKINHNARIVLDPSYPDVDERDYKKQDWTNFYGKETEPIPSNAPEPLGKEFIMRAYVDASFANCKLTRRSRTGFVIFLNCAPIYWFSKKQGFTEISTFGSEFVAMRQCCEYVRGLRYKLRMMGINVSNPTLIYGDNQSVLWNTKVPKSALKKKLAAVAYHFCREGVARNEWVTNYCKTSENPGDVMTKTVVQERKKKIRMLLYDIYPEESDIH